MHCTLPDRFSFLFFPIIFLFYAPIAIAQNLVDKTLPIVIASDNAHFERFASLATHEGNVILTQGNNELRASKLTIKKEGKRSIITAFGHFATFTGKLGQDPHPVYAKAKIIYYYPDKQLIILEGDATVEHEKDKFQGPTLTYKLDTQVITARRSSDGRPTVTLHPRA